MLIKELKNKLKEITGKENIYLTKRGNSSIKESLKYAKSIGYENVFIQDQGGWLTYPQFIKKLKLKLHYIKTDYGLITKNSELNILSSNYVLLINTMPAYSYLQDTSIIDSKINIINKNKDTKCLTINDVAGSIGHPESKWGDIIIGSFGKQKPINLEKGGFIATNIELDLEEEEFNDKEQKILLEKLNNLESRISFFQKVHNKIINELDSKYSNLDIIHKNINGINVIIKIEKDNNEIKNKIIEYCNENKYEYTECPRYIRITEHGISIEVKRLEE